MRKEYYKVELDMTHGSAYYYKKDSKIPTKIKFGRIESEKFKKHEITGNFTNIEMHGILFLIKRGCTLSEINNFINTRITNSQ